MGSEEIRTGKRPYEKPELHVIDLAPKDVLAVGCKMISSSWSAGNPVACHATNCSAVGS